MQSLTPLPAHTSTNMEPPPTHFHVGKGGDAPGPRGGGGADRVRCQPTLGLCEPFSTSAPSRLQTDSHGCRHPHGSQSPARPSLRRVLDDGSHATLPTCYLVISHDEKPPGDCYGPTSSKKESLCHKQVKGSKIQNSELSIDFGPDGDFMQAHRAIALPPPMRPCFSGDAARRGPDFPFLSAAMQPFHWGKLRASLRWSQLLRGPSCPHIPPGMVAGSVHLLAHQGPPSPCLGHSSSREAGTPHTWPPRGSGLSADLRASCRGHTLLVPVDP